jgi:hypothetical protein
MITEDLWLYRALRQRGNAGRSCQPGGPADDRVDSPAITHPASPPPTRLAVTGPPPRRGGKPATGAPARPLAAEPYQHSRPALPPAPSARLLPTRTFPPPPGTGMTGSAPTGTHPVPGTLRAPAHQPGPPEPQPERSASPRHGENHHDAPSDSPTKAADRLIGSAAHPAAQPAHRRGRYSPTGSLPTVINPGKWPSSTRPAIDSRSASENGFSTRATPGSSLPCEARTGRA